MSPWTALSGDAPAQILSQTNRKQHTHFSESFFLFEVLFLVWNATFPYVLGLPAPWPCLSQFSIVTCCLMAFLDPSIWERILQPWLCDPLLWTFEGKTRPLGRRVIKDRVRLQWRQGSRRSARATVCPRAAWAVGHTALCLLLILTLVGEWDRRSLWGWHGTCSCPSTSREQHPIYFFQVVQSVISKSDRVP